MDIQQIAEKIFNFCKEKYPDLDWNCDFTDNEYETIRCLTFNDYIEISYGFWLGAKERRTRYIAWRNSQIGRFKIWINPHTDDTSDRYEDIIVFKNIAYYKHEVWDAEYWKLVNRYKKVVLDIFNFILDEIQE